MLVKRILSSVIGATLSCSLLAATAVKHGDVNSTLARMHKSVTKQLPSLRHITQIMIILNSRYGDISEKAGQYYLNLSELQPFTEVYTTHPTHALVLLPTDYIFTKIWDGKDHKQYGHNKSFVHLKSLAAKEFGDKVRHFTLSSPEQTGKNAWSFLLKGYPHKKPPPVGDYELAHVFITQCHIKKISGKVRFLC